MSLVVTPRSLLLEYVAVLCHQVPGILEGQPDSVHAARVATRRVREVLPLTSDSHGPHVVEHLQDRFRVLGRALGKVRDADVQTVLLRYLESRVPTAAPVLVLTRQQQERRRLRMMRKLIKQLETDELTDVIKGAVARHRLRSWWSRAQGSHWRNQLRWMAAERARKTLEAVRHATGVYFPNRTHDARIAIKKLRYVVEIGEATNTLSSADGIRGLKATQDILGDLHDRQTLIDELVDDPPGDSAEAKKQIGLITQVLEAEIHDLHRRFLSRRDRVQAIACDRLPVRRALPAAPPLLIAVGAAAAAAYSYRSATMGSILEARRAGT